MRIINVGIDLSSTKIGYAIIEEKNLIESGVVELIKFSEVNFEKNAKIIANWLNDLFSDFNNCYFNVGFELTNFKSPVVSNRHNYYMGSIVQHIINNITNNYFSFKFFNAVQWHKIMGWHNLEREKVKADSLCFFLEQNGKPAIDDNEADAFCICWNLESLNSTEEQNIYKVEEKLKKIRERNEKYKISKMLMVRYKKKQTPRIKKEIAELEKKLRDLENGKTRTGL